MSILLHRLRPFRRPLHVSFTRSTATTTTALPRIPTLRERLARTSPNPSIFASIRTPPVWKYILLATLSRILIYDTASSETNRVTDAWSERVGIRYTLAGPRQPTSHDVRAAKQKALFERLVTFNESVTAFAEHRFVPPLLKPAIRTAYIWCANHWIAANEGVRAAYVLNAVHLSVYLVGKVPRFRGFFGRHLVHDPLSGRAHTILTGLLYHRSFLHLAVNSAFLTAFANTSTLWLSLEDARFSPDGVTHIPEVTTAYHFLALYACAGILSLVVAYVVPARVVYPSIVRRLASSSSDHHFLFGPFRLTP